MEPLKTNLGNYDNGWYQPGANPIKRGLWYLVNAFLIKSWIPGSFWRRGLLRVFGANIGSRVVIKPHVNIKYPWNLVVGDRSWIGEYSWIDNLGKVWIGDDCCLSQGCYLLCGNHNYKKISFDLIVGNITLEHGAWIGAFAIVGPGVTIHSHAVLSAGSIASKDLESFAIYTGNPAIKVRERILEN